jgi:nucleoside-diphosphate-sugar epimerase
MAWCFLRASFFMQNLNTAHRAEIQQRSEIFAPVGRGLTSFIDVRDIGEVAALTLTRPEHANQAYDLTGPQALDYYQVAEIFSQELGRKVTYRNPSAIHFLGKSLLRGIPAGYALIMTWLYTQTRKGMSAQVTDTVNRLLQRPPLGLQQYVRDYRAMWLNGKETTPPQQS